MRLIKNSRQLNIKVIFGIVILCIFSFTIGNAVSEIFFPTTPEGITNGYLKAWQLKNADGKREFSCFPENPVKALDLNVQSWEVLGKNEKVQKYDPESKYFEVLVKVEYLSKNNFSVKRTIIFNVWNPDELFESNKRLVDRVDRLIERSREAVNVVREAFGDPIEKNDEKPLPVPTRDNFSYKKYCVTNIDVLSF